MDTLHNSLGKFYFAEHSNSPPTFLQIIGWTKKAEAPSTQRMYVYVRRVPLNVQHSHCNGRWNFNRQIIDDYSAEIKTPLYKSVDSAIIIPGGDHIRYRGITVPKFDTNIFKNSY